MVSLQPLLAGRQGRLKCTMINPLFVVTSNRHSPACEGKHHHFLSFSLRIDINTQVFSA